MMRDLFHEWRQTHARISSSEEPNCKEVPVQYEMLEEVEVSPASPSGRQEDLADEDGTLSQSSTYHKYSARYHLLYE